VTYFLKSGAEIPEDVSIARNEKGELSSILAFHRGGRLLLGVYNFADEPLDVTAVLPQGGLFAAVPGNGDCAFREDGNRFTVIQLPAHALRVYESK
jgi:hypothetical protein